MTQVSYEELMLDEVIRSASTIVVATRTDPPGRTDQIPVNQKTWDDKDAPPFNYYVQVFTVDTVLRGDTQLAGRNIDVHPPGLKSQFESHVAYYVDGLGESPIVPCYRAKGNTDGNQLILFLQMAKSPFEFCFEGSIEGPDREGEVRRLATAGSTDVYPAAVVIDTD